ncbi:MAG: hypothetical protein N4A38_04170 [Candidatus Gracilibacteria bacterium]|nr:hypothetical protein [Candidatus Gracilibacteria bacterium]
MKISKNNIKNNGGYSTVLALLLVGFMIIITTGIFNLVMNEMKDTRGMSHYFKAYAGAEAGIELGLLDIKNGEELINIDENNPKSDILDSKTKVVYNFDGYTGEYIKNGLKPGEYALVDLVQAKNPTLVATGQILWNIVGKENGITGKGNSFSPYTNGNKKTLNSSDNFIYDTQSINGFLNSSIDNYLIVYNPTLFDVNFTLNVGNGEKIYKDTIGLKSSGISGKYKQNLILDINKSGYLNFLKYSIFSL